jgi:hypothetical protein
MKEKKEKGRFSYWLFSIFMLSSRVIASLPSVVLTAIHRMTSGSI